MKLPAPAPWGAHQNTAGYFEINTGIVAGGEISYCSPVVAYAFNNPHYSHTVNRHEANATLIAAAPELLEALKLSVRAWGHDGFKPVIAKAYGCDDFEEWMLRPATELEAEFSDAGK